MKKISDLLPYQQDALRSQIRVTEIKTDPDTGKSYVVFMGEQIDYESIQNFKFLQG